MLTIGVLSVREGVENPFLRGSIPVGMVRQVLIGPTNPRQIACPSSPRTESNRQSSRLLREPFPNLVQRRTQFRPPRGLEPPCVRLPFRLVRSQRGYDGLISLPHKMTWSPS